MKKAKHQQYTHTSTGFDSTGGGAASASLDAEVGHLEDHDDDYDEIAELQEIERQKQIQEKVMQQYNMEQMERERQEKFERQAKINYYSSYA